MKLPGLKDILVEKQPEKIHWGEALALWDIARNKLIGLAVLEVFLDQAQDEDLKRVIQMGIKNIAMPNIKRIQIFMEKEGLEIPKVTERTNLDLIGRDTGNSNFLKDSEIASSLQEIMRLAVKLDLEGVINSTREDVINLMWDILMDDLNSFKGLLDLIKAKNWLIPPPEAIRQ